MNAALDDPSFQKNLCETTQIDCFKCLDVYARVLTSILASTSFATHMRVLLQTEFISFVTPKFANLRVYKRFAKDHELGFEPASWDAPAVQDDYLEVGDPKTSCELVLIGL